MISPESPLNRLPEGLPRKQVLFYDAIAHSLETIERTYIPLRQLLVDHALGKLPEISQRDLFVDALIGAWGMVDALHRLGRLLCHTPGLKHGPAVTSLLKTLDAAEAFRHEAQHLDEHIGQIAETAMPVWGYLTWATAVDENRSTMSVLIPGHVAPGEFKFGAVPPGRPEPPGDHVKLRAAEGGALDLSEQYRAVVRFAARFEHGAATAWNALPGPPPNANGEVVRVDVLT
jgi:hypothetical protein